MGVVSSSADVPDPGPTGGAVPGVELESVPYRREDWARVVARYSEAEAFHSPEWLAYLAATQGARPVVAVVRAEGRPVGHFVGAVVRRFGVKILGSPMPGWGTQHMGFLLEQEVDRGAVAAAVLRYAFGELGCVHVELSNRSLSGENMVHSGYVAESGATYLIDLRASEEDILARMSARTRTYVRRAARNGLRAEIGTDGDFADEYHAQLSEVFARQGLAPTYGVERVRHLIEEMGPSGQLLLLRVRGDDGVTLATGVSVGRNGVAVNWGTASAQTASALHPNELLWWEMMRIWRSRGVSLFDMGGRGDYKAKYGGVLTPTVSFRRSRFGGLEPARAAAKRLVKARQAYAGRRGAEGSPRSSGGSGA
jgi:CelD/BcsL family acetyltransferase involved in cellulose biosynthesis